MNRNVIVSIIVGAALISVSVVYLAMSGNSACSNENIKAAVKDGLNEFITNGPEAAEQPTEEVPTVEPSEVDMEAAMDDDPMIGNKDAPITIVEWSDFQCPYCVRFIENAYQQIKADYIEAGLVKLVFRDLPLSFHEGAMPAAVAANCAREQGGDEVYFEMHDLLFADNSILGGSADSIKEGLTNYAGELGLNIQDFESCLDSGKFDDEIAKDIADAQKYGISGTPSFLIDGQVLVGAQPIGAFEAIIAE